MKNRNHRKTNFISKHILYIVVPAVLLIMFTIGLTVGLSIGNAIHSESYRGESKSADVLSQVMITSDSTWNGEARR